MRPTHNKVSEYYQLKAWSSNPGRLFAAAILESSNNESIGLPLVQWTNLLCVRHWQRTCQSTTNQSQNNHWWFTI